VPKSAIVYAAVGAVVGAALCRVWPAPEQGPPPPREVAGTVAEILAQADPLQRAAGLGEVLPRLGADAAPAGASAFDAARLDQGSPELLLLAHWWARLDPEAAFRWTRSDWRADDARVIAAVVRAWAHRNPQAALGAARGLSYPEQAQVALDAAISGWDESGQGGLDAWVQGLSDPIDRQRVGEILARRKVISQGAEKALEWADAIEDPTFREEMRGRVAGAAALDAPAVAAAWAEPRIVAAAEAGERPTGLPRRIGTRWSRSDPKAAMAWLSRLPPGGDRDDGVIESMRIWLGRDPGDARQWVEVLEPERWNEPARALYARGLLAQEDPERALALVAGFEDPDLRDYHTTVIARAWLARDRAAADAWLQQADIPEAVKRRAYMVSNRAGRRAAGQPAGDEGEP
jgi:hypothetical protein